LQNSIKILIIRFSSLGDIILTFPALNLLRKNYPDSQIDYLTKLEYKSILINNPDINNVITVPDDVNFKQLRETKTQLRLNRYDVVVDFHNNLRSFYIRLFFNGKKLVFKKYSFRKFLLVRFKINLMKALPPIGERYCDTLSPLLTAKPQAWRGVSRHEVSGRGVLTELNTDLLPKQNIDKLFIEIKIQPDKKIICIAPSSKHFTKTYPAELYVKIINSLNKEKYNVLLVGKDDDEKNIKHIISLTGTNVFNLCNRLNLLELTEVINRSTLFISGDTGPMHIAESLNKPIIMLAGSSVKEFGFYPHSENATVFEAEGLSCRPCSHIGRSSCPKGHLKCMKEIPAESILQNAVKLT
jgi:heptosyltransferase-2